MATYTTVSAVKADLPDSALFDSTDTSYDDVISGMITAASRLIDREVGGWPDYFYPSTASQTRYFDGSGDKVQEVDPMISLTSVSVAETGGRAATDYTDWTENTDYYVWPYNYSYTNKPIRRLIVDNDSGSKGVFSSDRKAVKVVGVFGYSEIPPAEIEQACKIQAMRWYMRAKQGYQDAGASAELGQMIYTQDLDPDVKRLLIPYKIDNIFME